MNQIKDWKISSMVSHEKLNLNFPKGGGLKWEHFGHFACDHNNRRTKDDLSSLIANFYWKVPLLDNSSCILWYVQNKKIDPLFVLARIIAWHFFLEKRRWRA